ncbi:integrase family domain protein (plasmid) [Bacillus thuringiensis serovar kurstaki]|uniref:Uncharacterized protein n=1 Tax=Bacillus cereus ISP2954 TaxID=1053215 RepID=A0A9W5QL10_BACCE|nr:transposase A [Bacillus thuringiensis serovar kurstaki str. YBT-1520]AIE37816.1 transposase A [Bacillus thuringiensis serovar kurstaki str. HD-1]AJK37721.1 integrase family domain protein [Bacillus thuringiensis serovar kurstaki]AKJ62385.1 hypothetical protein XI92_29885 [Bacillus thuringiensis]EOP39445.1 hypothetical protein IGG_06686 [Bacillus cereus HuB13-1]EOP72145.1 hypothetical protein IGU_06709 [Bacillus cereus ISP2954]EOP82244.1 hypothetical protein IES_06227 [Bacillus cereus BMG1.
MRVQEVILENGKRYILVDSDGVPVIPVVKYLKYLDVTGKSSNTRKTYCCTQTVFLVLTGNRERLQAYKIRGLGGVCGMASESV